MNFTKVLRRFRRSWLAGALSLCCISSVLGQSAGDLVDFVQTGKEDASQLTRAYLNPVVEGISYGVNGGWYHTAKAHKSLGFDLAISVNAVFIPGSHRFFKPEELDLKNTQLTFPANGEAPTIIGPEENTTYQTNVTGQQVVFDGPEGLDMKKRFKVQGVATPMIQAGIGIYKNTDLKIRFYPESKVGDDGKVKMIGFGIMHDIKQHIPGLKIVPFDLSIMVAYTNVSGEVNMESEALRPAGNTDPQVMPFDVKAWTYQALISKKLTMVTFYGGVGYNAIKSTADIQGSYDIDPTSEELILVDPVYLKFKDSSFRITGGIRLSFGGFFLNADYTWQEYSTVSAGLGFTFR